MQSADYFYGPLHYSRSDALAAAIMRGRDLGVAPYRALRSAYGLEPRGWQQVSDFWKVKMSMGHARFADQHGNDAE